MHSGNAKKEIKFSLTLARTFFFPISFQSVCFLGVSLDGKICLPEVCLELEMHLS